MGRYLEQSRDVNDHCFVGLLLPKTSTRLYDIPNKALSNWASGNGYISIGGQDNSLRWVQIGSNLGIQYLMCHQFLGWECLIKTEVQLEKHPGAVMRVHELAHL